MAPWPHKIYRNEILKYGISTQKVNSWPNIIFLSSKLLSRIVSCGPQIIEFNFKIRNNLGQDTVSILSLLEICENSNPSSLLCLIYAWICLIVCLYSKQRNNYALYHLCNWKHDVSSNLSWYSGVCFSSLSAPISQSFYSGCLLTLYVYCVIFSCNNLIVIGSVITAVKGC